VAVHPVVELHHGDVELGELPDPLGVRLAGRELAEEAVARRLPPVLEARSAVRPTRYGPASGRASLVTPWPAGWLRRTARRGRVHRLGPGSSAPPRTGLWPRPPAQVAQPSGEGPRAEGGVVRPRGRTSPALPGAWVHGRGTRRDQASRGSRVVLQRGHQPQVRGVRPQQRARARPPPLVPLGDAVRGVGCRPARAGVLPAVACASIHASRRSRLVALADGQVRRRQGRGQERSRSRRRSRCRAA
jgi:hypothetical protein